MTTPKHTPGPWKHPRTPQDYGIVGPEDERIATTYHQPVHAGRILTVAEQDANAEFIVRACNAHDDLLAACEAAVALFDVTPDSSLPHDLKAQCRQMFQRDPVCQQLVAVIAKAREGGHETTGTN